MFPRIPRPHWSCSLSGTALRHNVRERVANTLVNRAARINLSAIKLSVSITHCLPAGYASLTAKSCRRVVGSSGKSKVATFSNQDSYKRQFVEVCCVYAMSSHGFPFVFRSSTRTRRMTDIAITRVMS